MQLRKKYNQKGMSALILLFVIVFLGSTVLAGGIITPKGIFPDAQKETNMVMINPIAVSQNGLQLQSAIAVTPTPTSTPTPLPTQAPIRGLPPPAAIPTTPSQPGQRPLQPTSAPPPSGAICNYNRNYNECCAEALSHRVDEYIWSDGSGVCKYVVGECNQSDAACGSVIPTPTSPPPPPPAPTSAPPPPQQPIPPPVVQPPAPPVVLPPQPTAVPER